VELFEEIRKAHDREELGIRALAHRFGVHRRAVRQALASPIPPPRKHTVRPSPALDPWKTTIDRWLAEGAQVPVLGLAQRTFWQAALAAPRSNSAGSNDPPTHSR
jgi:hypothetical protein